MTRDARRALRAEVWAVHCKDNPSTVPARDASYGQQRLVVWFACDVSFFALVQDVAESVKGLGHAGFDGAFGDGEHVGDFAELEALIMAQNNDHTIGFRKLEERAPDAFGAFARDEVVGSE